MNVHSVGHGTDKKKKIPWDKEAGFPSISNFKKTLNKNPDA